jgi:hypothetical protein
MRGRSGQPEILPRLSIPGGTDRRVGDGSHRDSGRTSIMAEYLILIYEDENGYANASPEVFQQVMEAHTRFAQQVDQKGGKIVSGNALQPTSTATSIRADVVTDGPFAETKEALGGYYLIQARDLDHALDISKLCPARFGGVEVRPIMDMSGG